MAFPLKTTQKSGQHFLNITLKASKKREDFEKFQAKVVFQNESPGSLAERRKINLASPSTTPKDLSLLYSGGEILWLE